MRRLILSLALMTLPVSAYAQADNPESQSEAQIVQEVIGTTLGESELNPDEALEEIRSGLLSLNPDEVEMLNGFSLNAQGNFALIRQEGSGNEAALNQQGDGNLAILIQDGHNITTSARQNGTGNVFGVHLEGDNLILGGTEGVTQIGNDNVYLLEYGGDDLRIPSTTQVGNSNQAVQVGEIAVPFGVQQYGNGMQMIIRHNGAQ